MKLALAVLAALVAVTPRSMAQTQSEPDTAREAAFIDWKAYQSALKAAKPKSKKTRAANYGDAISNTQLPVLMATHDAVRAAPDFQSQGSAYVAQYDLPGMKIAVLGSASHILSTSPGAAKAERDAPYSFEVNEDITDLTFARFGAAYTVRASCEREDDARCAQPAFLTTFMQSLIPVKR
jgi:hypothetical protein